MKRPSAVSLLWQQMRYQNKLFWRTPVAAFFTLLFPLLILVVFAGVFGSGEIDYLGVTVAQYYAPALAVFSAASATYTNIGVGTAYQRDQGILKRVRGTPLPSWIYFGGKVLSGAYIAAIGVIIMLTAGVAFYGLQIYPRTLPAAVVTFLIGVGSFAALGLFVAGVSPSGNAATAICNATLLPLAFFSGIFIVGADLPRWMSVLGDLFPLKHFNLAFQAAFDPQATGLQFQWDHLAVMVLWGVAGLVLARLTFRWESRPGGTGRNRKRLESVES